MIAMGGAIDVGLSMGAGGRLASTGSTLISSCATAGVIAHLLMRALGWVGSAMNFVVITAALSSCNSGLYSIGRIFRTMANNGHAPAWLTKMSSRHVPYAAILSIAGVYVVGVLANIWLGGSFAFDLALNTASIGVIFTWGSIFACQIMLRHKKGKVSSLPMPDGGHFVLGLWTLCAVPVLAVVLWFGWQLVKKNEPKNALFT